MAKLEIKLHPKQLEVLNSPERFKILICGRRFGKTYLSAYTVIISALKEPNGTFFIVSPNYNMTKILWRMIKRFLPREYIKRIMEGELYIELINGSMIFARSGDNPDGLRGEGLNGVVLDEAAFLRPEVWNEAIRPALADKKGWALIISCITKDSYILSQQGITVYSNKINITGMINEPIPCKQSVYGLHGLNNSEFSWENGKTKTYKVTMEGGYRLEGTPNHPIFAKSTKYKKRGEWITLEDINTDCFAALQLNQQVFGNDDVIEPIERKKKERHRIALPEKANSEISYLVGLLLGDGYVDKRSITITTKDKEIIDFCKTNPLGLCFYISPTPEDCYHLRAGSDLFIRFLESIGYEFVKAKHKKIPERCFRWSKENICALLRGLFDTDGTVNRKVCADGRVRVRVAFTSSSKVLHDQIKYLLLNLGIVSSSHEREVKPTEKVLSPSHIYILEIADYTAVKRFSEQIGFNIKRKSDVFQHLGEKGKRARIYEDRGEYEIKWCRITKKEESEAETYDLHIPGSHSFFTNGFISHNTPKGKNWLFELFLRGCDDSQPDYRSFSYSSFDNPLIAPTEIEEMSKNLPEISYKQEILAQFIEGGGLVFRGIDKIMTAYPEQPIPGQFYIMGVDLGRHEDFTVISVARTDDNRQVYMERFNRTDWDYIKDRVREVQVRYNNAPIIIDSTGYGDPIYEDLAKEGINITGININVSTKPMMIENLQLLIENQQITLLNDKDTSLEFSSYTYTLLPSGHVRYEAPKGFHDDIVMGIALMGLGLTRGGGGMIGEVQPDEESPSAELYNEIEDVAEDWDDYDFED